MDRVPPAVKRSPEIGPPTVTGIDAGENVRLPELGTKVYCPVGRLAIDQVPSDALVTDCPGR
jgi:hypothetical protein